MKKFLVAIMALVAIPMFGQQSHVNIDWRPQKNTENITPFSANVISPEVNDDHTVTFRVRAPKAERVTVSGSMFAGTPAARGGMPLVKDEATGIWSVTTAPLEPEMYFYWMNIDGVNSVDPNCTFAGHAAMPPFSILYVHGNEPNYFDPKPGIPHGTVTTHYYESSVTNGTRSLMVYTPANYNPKKKYPVLYLMGGSGDIMETWVMHGNANFILDNLIAEGKCREMIVVFPNNQMVTRNHPKHTELAFPLFEREIIDVIIPYIESNYSCIKDKHARALSGLSMGGRMTQYVVLRNLDVFGSAGILSAAIDIDQTPALRDKDVNSKIDYLFLGAGPHETNPRARHEVFHKELEELGVEHEYYIVGGAHDMVTWKRLIYDRFLPNLFRTNYKWK